MIKKIVVLILLTFVNFSLFAQDEEVDSIIQTGDLKIELSKREIRKIKKDSIKYVKDSIANDTNVLKGKKNRQAKFLKKIGRKKEIDALAPSRAAFYSAILPGLGQVYNKKYWKVPIVYAALGTSIYFYIDYNNQYNSFRDAYKRRLAGYTDDEYYADRNGIRNEDGTPYIKDSSLLDAQERLQRERDLSLLITIGLYALNIVDANVDAHLNQFNINDDLSLNPIIYQNQINFKASVGFSISYKF